MPIRLTFHPRFSTTELLQSPTPLHDSLASEVNRSFMRPYTEGEEAGHLVTVRGTAEELMVGEERIIRTPDLLIAYRPPESQDDDEQPMVVLEVGFTQSYDSLRRWVDTWMAGKPTLKMVLLVKMKEHPRYVRQVNVDYVLEKGVGKFPAASEISFRDVEESNPGQRGGPLSMYGMSVLGRVTGFLEVWVRDETGKGVMRGEPIVCLPKKKTLSINLKVVPNLHYDIGVLRRRVYPTQFGL